MKKTPLILIFGLAFTLISCGSTSNVETNQPPAEDSAKQETVQLSPAETAEIKPKEEEKQTGADSSTTGNIISETNKEIPQEESAYIPEGVTAEIISTESGTNDEEQTFEVVTLEDSNPEEIPQEQLVLESVKTEEKNAQSSDPLKEIAQAVAKLEEKVDGLIAEKDNSSAENDIQSNENKAPNEHTEVSSAKDVISEKITNDSLNKPVKETVKEDEIVTTTQSIQSSPETVHNEQIAAGGNENSEEKAGIVQETAVDENSSEGSETDLFETPALIKPSRAVTVKTNQFLDVTYPGKGWIYIGETQKDPLLTYFGRKLSKGNTTFSLKSKKSGQTVLHFYKNDPLTGNYIDDYLDVTVETEVAKSNKRAQAPHYAEIVPPKPEKRGVTFIEPENQTAEKTEESKEIPNEIQKEIPAENKSSAISSVNKNTKPENNTISHSSPVKIETDDENIKTVVENTLPADRPSSSIKENDVNSTRTIVLPAGNLLEEAKKALEEKKYESALSYIQVYLDSESTKIDEALFVQGQILEAESPVKNVRSAIDSYNTIIKKHPASKWWKRASERSIYLKRFYIDIR